MNAVSPRKRRSLSRWLSSSPGFPAPALLCLLLCGFASSAYAEIPPPPPPPPPPPVTPVVSVTPGSAITEGETAARIEVLTLDDKQVEADETVSLVFTEPQHVLPPDTLTVTIRDDDAVKAAELEHVNRAILPQVSAALVHTRLNQLQDCLDAGSRQTDVGSTLTGLVQRLPQDNAALQGDDRSVWERFGGRVAVAVRRYGREA